MKQQLKKPESVHVSAPHCWNPMLRVWPQICPDLMKSFPRKDHGLRVVVPDDAEPSSPTHTRGDCWTDLPQHLLERIFEHLKDENDVWEEQRNYFVVSGVCKTWRSVAKEAFISDPWARAPLICHPKELFTLSPVPVERRLLQCFVKRTEIRSTLGALQGYRYTLHYGADYNDQNAKLLLSAVQDNRNNIKICSSSDTTTEPVARLTTNVLKTSYNLIASKCSWIRKLLGNTVPAVAEGSDKPLAGIQYKLRMQGIMLPRRMRVTLPYCTSWHTLPESGTGPEGVSRSPSGELQPSHSRGNSGDIPVPDLQPQASSSAQAAAAGGSSAPGLAARGLSSGGASTSLSPDSHEEFGLQLVNRCATMPLDPCSPASVASPQGVDMSMFEKARQKRLEAGLKLKNKQPHWNEGLRCWCLNFRGRVKLASVKNFQLVRAEDACKRVVMQFGKVDKHTFIMDYNPCVLSAVQAFALSLTTFGGKFLL